MYEYMKCFNFIHLPHIAYMPICVCMAKVKQKCTKIDETLLPIGFDAAPHVWNSLPSFVRTADIVTI